ncbi:hypothetical protein [Halorientalis halophila]|uniref:hypothetical protein n=1 Tax=Halorientalis halophila TaxID=3108499 RepID=UPI003008690A
MTVPGFVVLGLVAVGFQLLVVGGLYWYVNGQQSGADPALRRRAIRVLSVGTVLALGGQAVALAATGSPRVSPLLSLRDAIRVQNAGFLAGGLGYLGVFAGFFLLSRAGDS